MGISGTLEYLADLMSSVKKGKKRKQMNTVSLKVRMDCEGCQRKVKNVLSSLKGINLSSCLSIYLSIFLRMRAVSL